uniref:TLC domain-containing protein n=1 Tax=Angiostrongylus cantonensis TaxID=6313 RepID=A0A0K0D802_ANGCA
LAEIIPQYIVDQRLQSSRIQNLKMCTIPLWIFSSFAVRNIVNSDFHPSIPGGLWVSDMLAPDPYFILPVVVGLFGFLNLYVSYWSIFHCRLSFMNKSI